MNPIMRALLIAQLHLTEFSLALIEANLDHNHNAYDALRRRETRLAMRLATTGAPRHD